MRTPNRVARAYQIIRLLRLGKVAGAIRGKGRPGFGVVSFPLMQRLSRQGAESQLTSTTWLSPGSDSGL